MESKPKNNKVLTFGIIGGCGCVGLLLLCGLIASTSNISKDNTNNNSEVLPTPTTEPTKAPQPTPTTIEKPQVTQEITKPVFKLNANDFDNTNVEDLLKKYEGSYVEEDSPTSTFYIKNDEISLSTSYKTDTKIVNKFTAELLSFTCEPYKEFSKDDVNKYLNYVGIDSVNSRDIRYIEVSGVTSIESKDIWARVSLNCFESKKVDITFIGK